MAGLIRAPHLYSPYKHPERAVERRNRVLTAMLEAVSSGGLPACDAHATPRRDSDARSQPRPYFVDLLREQLLQRYSAEELTDQQPDHLPPWIFACRAAQRPEAGWHASMAAWENQPKDAKPRGR